MKVKIEQLTLEQIKEYGIDGWPVWEKEVSQFPWHYDMTERALVLEGKVVVNAYGNEYEIKAGDFVTFPAGMDCEWTVIETIRKRYNFQ
jgi:uncharacterized protein